MQAGLKKVERVFIGDYVCETSAPQCDGRVVLVSFSHVFHFFQRSSSPKALTW